MLMVGFSTSAKCSFALQTRGFGYFSSIPRFLMCLRAVCSGGKTVSVLTWRNVSCDLTKKVQKAQRPMVVVEKTCFSILFHDNCGLFLFLIFKKFYFTAVVSYFCKRFANQNAMYSRYGLYFRFTALQTVCKYDQLNEWKGSDCVRWLCDCLYF